jgi:MFS family permease
VLSLAGVSLFLTETRQKKTRASIDISGAFSLSVSVLALLFIFLLAGREHAWSSPRILVLWAVTLAFAGWFYLAERRAKEPILPISLFKLRGYSVGNAAVFMSSFAIFSFFGFAPLFVQGALGKSPVEVGTTILALSLGWSLGSLFLGRLVHRWGSRRSAAAGAVFLATGCALTLTFSTGTSMATCFWVFALVGVGMGFVGLATILVVQNSVDGSDLGVATASHQFTRSLGATVGIGICGSIFTAGFTAHLQTATAGSAGPKLPAALIGKALSDADSILRPEVRAQLSPDMLRQLNQAVAHGVFLVFCASLAAALACLFFCLLLPREKR